VAAEDITPDPVRRPKPPPLPVEPLPLEAVTPEPMPLPARPAPPRFDAVPYEPDGGAPAGGVALLLAGTLGAAALIGLGVSFLHEYFYIVLFMPMLMGGLVGLAGVGLVRAGKVRNPGVATVIGVLGGVAVMFFMHYWDALRFLAGDLLDYLDLRATAGVTISHTGGGQGGMNLGYVGSWIYWVVETAIAAAIAGVVVRLPTASPFCAACGVWKEARPLGSLEAPLPVAKSAVEEGEVARLMECRRPAAAQGLRLQAHVCPRCEHDGEVEITLENVLRNPKGQNQTVTVTRTTYPGDVLSYL
jgi:hypothetical protein